MPWLILSVEMKKVAGTLRLDLAQYRELDGRLESFAERIAIEEEQAA